MNPQLIWTIVAVVAIIVVVAGFFFSRKRRTDALRRRFGPEYARVVKETGAVSQAEAMLQARAARVERLHIRPLSSEDAARFSDAWKRIQTQFVDDPRDAVTQADRVVGEVMHARGYPIGDFDQQAADISVDHPHVVSNYRAARAIAQAHARGEASTEDLRQAMVHYRALFDDLLDARTPDRRSEVAAERSRR